ncbi:MAG: sigma-70 family RNA polymerase sigma factor [Alistipes sp.]|nr:sigma-70 family RNA polymerase sigma factor [Alistipes sp.]
MTDAQLIFGILQNDERTWRYIYREMKSGFASILAQSFSVKMFSNDEIDDIFQDSLIVLMQRVKSGDVTSSREGALFAYLVQIGKFTAHNLLRRKGVRSTFEKVTNSAKQHNSIEEGIIAVDEKQQTQNDFLDTVIQRLPEECKAILKYFYWDHKPMDEIASILGMRSADSAKSKKSKCMNKIRNIAAQLFADDDFAEEVVRNAIERAALRELIEEERYNADNGFCMAALDIDSKAEDNEGEI